MHLCQNCGNFSTYHVEERATTVEFKGTPLSIRQKFAVCDNCSGIMPIEGVMLDNLNAVRVAYAMAE